MEKINQSLIIVKEVLESILKILFWDILTRIYLTFSTFLFFIIIFL